MRINVRGTVYESAAAAAEALGVSKDAVYHAVANGRTDTLGLGKGAYGRHRPPIAPVLMVVGAKVYPSTKAAMRATGLSHWAIKKMRREARGLT